MAEVQKNTSPISAGELAQRFVQFVMIQAQNIFFLLGKIPSPDGHQMPPNLEASKMLIDQLEMIREKTNGNLSAQETKILENAISNLRMAFVEASGGTPPSMMPPTRLPELPPDFLDEEEEEAPALPSKPEARATPPPVPAEAPAAPEPIENKKKFTKTYN